jgi:hypothetical protein
VNPAIASIKLYDSILKEALVEEGKEIYDRTCQNERGNCLQ